MHKYATDNKSIPESPHFAALVFTSKTVYHEGDERSRTHPGHGYPAHTETIRSIDYIVFDSVGDMEKWVIAQETKTGARESYKIIQSTPKTVKLNATVSLG